ncbi:MAG TPA: DUF2796 domain-containing protein [Dyella sp.]|uniref:ZrgA family zinc uptake protein n=1 Tax=Dyella sp. TaxID=1869338 RepID=UPI002F95E8F2
MRTVSLAALGLLLAIQPVLAQAPRRLGVHVHGVTAVDIGLEGSTLQVTLDAPAINMLGFEHPPHNDTESKQIEAVLASLHVPAPWLEPATAARCVLADSRIQASGLSASAPSVGHADIDARYSFRCAEPGRLDHIDIHLADRYPATHGLAVDIVLPQKQERQELGQGEFRVMLAP